MDKSGAQITAANPVAEAQGFLPGMTITDARAINPSLLVEAADKDGDREALRQLTLWCQRYSPLTRTEDLDGISIDITGCAHLFGGEAALADDLADRFCGFGLTARLAITSTIGAAWALARYGHPDITIVSAHDIKKHLTPLPVASLRLNEMMLSALAKVGLDRIGLIIGKARAPLASRFGNELLYRLDQALGYGNETFNPLDSPPHYYATCRLAEPVITLEAVEEAVLRLMRDLTEKLFRAGKGTRRLELTLYRVDGWQERLGLRVSSLSRDTTHLSRLLCERLDTIKDNAGFGFEAARLSAFDTEEMDEAQQEFPSDTSLQTRNNDLAQLLDRLANRFGPDNINRFVPKPSYIPEQASQSVSVLESSKPHDWDEHNQNLQGKTPFARPLMLFHRPEEVQAIAETPDKPPARFIWRRITHRITRADGPERIAPEWWRQNKQADQTRDYYRVEDESGHRFWLYRDGLHERSGDTPKWFIHGLFA